MKKTEIRIIRKLIGKDLKKQQADQLSEIIQIYPKEAELANNAVICTDLICDKLAAEFPNFWKLPKKYK